MKSCTYVMYRWVCLISLSAAGCSAAILALVVERVFEESQWNTAPLLERLVWTNEQLSLVGWSQPIRGLPTIQSVMFLRKPDDDITFTIKAERDITSGHLEPGCSTEHWALVFLAPHWHFVADRGNRLPLSTAAASNVSNSLFYHLFICLVCLS